MLYRTKYIPSNFVDIIRYVFVALFFSENTLNAIRKNRRMLSVIALCTSTHSSFVGITLKNDDNDHETIAAMWAYSIFKHRQLSIRYCAAFSRLFAIMFSCASMGFEDLDFPAIMEMSWRVWDQFMLTGADWLLIMLGSRHVIIGLYTHAKVCPQQPITAHLG